MLQSIFVKSGYGGNELENLFYTLAIVFFIGIFIFLVKSVISAIKKKGKGKFFLKLSGVSFVALIICVILGSNAATKKEEAIKQTKLEAYHKTPEYKAKVAEEKALKAKIETEKKAKLAVEAKKRVEEKKMADAEKLAKKKAEAKLKVINDYNDWITSQFSAWNGSIPKANEMIKEHMNNPNSFEHVETTYENLGLHKGIRFLVTYRGTNAFGGIVTNQAKGTINYTTHMIHIQFLQ